MAGTLRASWVALVALGAPLWAQDPAAAGPRPADPERPSAPSTEPAVQSAPPVVPEGDPAVRAGGPVQDPVQAPAQTPSPAAATTPPAATPPAPAPVLPPAWDARYRTHDEVVAWANAWIASGLAEPVALPASRSGRAAPALQFGAPGPRPLAERPTVFLLGGLDGVSLAGAEGVLRAADELLRARDALPPAVAFVCVPWAAPDGLARTLAGDPCDGRDRLALDDDGDLALDEDGPDDVDGDGQILEMLV